MEALSALTFEPIFQPYLWGGRQLAHWFSSAPTKGPVAEAWLVSDEAKFPSRVAGGSLAGRSLRQLAEEFGPRLLGKSDHPGERFPLLLKLLDARDHLSVQVHPNDRQAAAIGPGLRGKTEAWVVLHAEPGARIFAGLKPGVDEAAMRRAITDGRVPDVLHSFETKAGDCVFLPAGTVHAIGAGLLLFEVQQTSDITYRLHDWDRVDPRTGRGRELHIEHSLACIDWSRGPAAPVKAQGELLVECGYFRLWQRGGAQPFMVGAAGECRIVVAVEGKGELRVGEESLPLRPGSVWLLPAEVGAADCRPAGTLTVLECGLP